jgi:Protein of unknown function (DUF4229)
VIVPFVMYSALRLALIAAVAVILYLVGMRNVLLWVVAIVLALLVSYLALGRQREAAAVYLAERRARRARTGERFSRAAEEDAAAEDEQVDDAVNPRSEGQAEPE